jgi:hypothetical protein
MPATLMPAFRFIPSRLCGSIAFALVVAWIVAVGGSAAGQPAEAPPRGNGSGAVQQVAPEIYYLRDDAGQLVPVPGFRYRDFVDLLRLKEGLPGLPETPAAVLESIKVAGTLPEPGRSGDASSPLTVTLTVRQIRAGWVSVSLELGGFVITGEPQHSGEGRFLLAVDPAANRQDRGYQGWFEGKADARHSVVLVGTAAVEAAPNAESIRLRLPAATASFVELRTPRTDPVVTVRPAVVEPRVAPSQAGGGSVISCAGLSGGTQIRVAARESGQSPSAASAQSAVESLVRIDGRIAVIDAVIRLDNLPADTETIRIALPPKAALKAVRAPAALVERAGSDEQPIAVVQVERTATGAAVVELACERPIDASGGESFEPQGFAIEGIPSWRQRGRTSLVVEGDWQLEWDEFARNRRIDPPSSARQPGFVAAFAYASQPASLPLRVRPRGSRVVMEPEYRYEIGATRIALEARFRVSVRGAPVSRIVVGLEGWGIDEVGPSSLVDTSAVSGESKALVIPFLQPLTGDAVVEIRAGRSIERSADRLLWKTPAPRADLVGPANVIIASQSDIEVLPDTDAIKGLVRQIAPAGRRGDGDRPTIAYRLDGVEGTFAASRRFLPRRVDATVSTQATVDEADMIVEQAVRLQVAHVPLEFIDLMVPEAIVRSRTLEVRQAGQLLQPFVAAELAAPRGNGGEEDEFDSPAQTAEAVLRAMLPVPLLGSGELTIRYSIPTASIPPETTVAEELPIVTPDGVRISQQTFTLFAQDQLAVDVRGDGWTRDAGLQASAPARSWTSAKPQVVVPLAISARQRSTAGETVVEAAWLETRLLPDARDDIYTYAIATSAERISFSLPQGFLPLRGGEVDPGAVEVRLDGQLVPGAVRPDGRVTVELPRPVAVNRGAWLLQIESSRERRGLFGGTAAGMPAVVMLDPPVFAEGAVLRRFYWELRLESDQHVVVPPARWTAQQRWGWGAFGLERVPVVSREVLSSWVRADTTSGGDRLAAGLGSTAAVAPPVDAPLAERRAVYSGVGFAGAARIWIVPTWLLVLAVSGPVLALGLAFVYRPAVRRTSIALALASGLVLAASAVPDRAPLFAQAAVPGLLFSLVAAALRFLVERPATTGREPLAPNVTSGSSTRFVPTPSLVIAPSAMHSHDSATTPGRSAS